MCLVANIASFDVIDTLHNSVACSSGTCALCWKFQIVDIGRFVEWSMLKEEREVGWKTSIYLPTQMMLPAK